MAFSSARHLCLLAFVAALAVATPRASAWGGSRFFFSKTARPQAAVDDSEKAAAGATTTAVPDAANPNSAMEFSRPSTGGSGRGYGLYGRPEENFPPDYFRRGVHRNAAKLTATSVPTTSVADEAVPVAGRGERGEPVEKDNGSGRGRPPWTNANVPTTSAEPVVEDNGSGRGRPPWTSAYVQTTTSTEETVPVGGRGGERAEPFVEDNGSGRGRPPWTSAYVPTTTRTEETIPVGGRGGERAEPFAEDNGSGMGRRPWRYVDDRRPEEHRSYYGMSDTRLYQNGRYYYDVDTGSYGYGRESNPVRTRPEEFAGDRRGRYYGNAAGYQYGNELGNGVMENQNGRYIP
jgi:hypothetical protein